MYSFTRLPAPLPRTAIQRCCHRRFVCAAQPLDFVTTPPILESKRHFVVLSDLHVKRETVSTCVQALKIAHEEALKRDAAILFLGDFWHARGALPVEPLNLVLKELQTWSVPVVMIPGNHDLISRTGNGVSLVPLATTLGANNCLLITKPSICLDALFLPYMHDTSRLKAALSQARHSIRHVNAVFCHVEVAGARLADKIVSKPSSRSVSPTDFPAKLPVYSGHLHRPHTVSDNIRYVGSPYEVSAAEQGQQKALLVLDRNAGWTVVDSIPIEVGPRHITINAQDSHSLSDIRPGDRIIVQTHSHDDAKLKRIVEQLRERGNRVEIQLVTHGSTITAHNSDNTDPFAPAEPRISPATLSNMDLFQEYATIKNLEPKITRVGKELLQEVMGKAPVLHSSISGKDVVIEWENVKLRGFGSFLKSVSYPLNKRGIVLVTGRDCNDEGTLSGRTNGTGKTTLVMSALWAMTGRTDARPDGSVERGVSLEMIHDDADHCEVSVNVNIRGDRVLSEAREMMSLEERQLAKLVPTSEAPATEVLKMVVTRTSSRPKTSSKTRSYRQGLHMKVNGVDLTCLDVRETQSRIDRLINGTLLPHTVFFGQHMGPGRGLVDSTDRTLKEHLALIFPLDIWKEARRMARDKISKTQDLIMTSEATLGAAKAMVSRLSQTETSTREQCTSFERVREEKVAALDSQINSLLSSKSRCDEDSIVYADSFAISSDQLMTIIDDCKLQLRRLEASNDSTLDTARAAASAATIQATAALDSAVQLQARITALAQKSEDWESDRRNRLEDIKDYLKNGEKDLQDMETLAVLDEEWKAASTDMRECDERFQELVKINIAQRQEAPTTRFATQLSVVHNAFERTSALQAERVQLQTSLKDVKERLLQSQDVSLVSQYAPGEDSAKASISTLTTCENCLRPFDGELYVQARSRLEQEAAAIEDAIRLSEINHEQEHRQYEQAVRTLSEHIEKERIRIRDKKSAIGELFSRIRAKRNARNSLVRDIEEFKKRAEVLRRERNLYFDELSELVPLSTDSVVAPLRNVDDIIKKAHGNVTACQESLASTQNHYEHVMDKVRKRDSDRAQLSLRRFSLQTHMDDLIDLQARCQNLENEKHAVLSERNPYMESLKRISDELEAESSKLQKRKQGFQSLKDSVNIIKSLDVAFGPRGVPSFVLEEGLLWLEKLTTTYLHKLSAGELMLQIRAFSDYKSSNRVDGDNKEVISKKVFVRKPGSPNVIRERSLRQLSGGQRRRCSVAFALAFADLTHERAGFQSSLIVMDEILQSLDEDGRQRISQILPSLIDERHATRDTILVVAQDEAPEIAELAHGGIDVVVRSLDESSVFLDGKEPETQELL